MTLLAFLLAAQSASPAPAGAAAAAQDPPVLTVIYRAMRASDSGRLDGVAYFMSRDNRLDTAWLAQTPNVWGMRAGQVPRGAGGYMVDVVRALVESARQFVDITSLAPFPTGQFETAIQQGLVSLAQSGRPVTVRILVGWQSFPPVRDANQSQYLHALIGPLKRIPSSRLTIYVASQRTGPDSWNHAKIVAVDGVRALTGGENLWDRNYLMSYPVHDLNVRLEGSVALGMHQFADRIWASVCAYKEAIWLSVYWKFGMRDVATGCLARHGLTPAPGPGTVPILGAGRLGTLDPNGNPADAGILAALESTTDTLRISQQDLGFSPVLWWKPGMNAIAKALVARKDVYIVLTNDDAKGGPDGTPYWTYVSVAVTGNVIKLTVESQPGAPTGSALVDLLCRRLHLAVLRFGPSEHWANGFAFANHAKFFMVDDRVFYVGSENLYPANLAEYGVFIADSVAVRDMRQRYWDQLWQYSSRTAISGSEAKTCLFRG